MADHGNDVPSCYGKLEIVFPKGEDGLRHSPEKCLSCPHKTPCLRSAVDSSMGREMKEKIVDKAYKTGMINFLERWSKKKLLKSSGKKK